MTTPSERIWAAADSDADAELMDFLPARARNPVSLAATADRIADGVERREAVADFLDDLQFARDDDDAAARVADEPQRIDQHVDAYLAALAEHIAASRGLPAPSWSRDASRFLDHFWWPSTTVALHARALVESPAAFRRRGIFIGRTSSRRV